MTHLAERMKSVQDCMDYHFVRPSVEIRTTDRQPLLIVCVPVLQGKEVLSRVSGRMNKPPMSKAASMSRSRIAPGRPRAARGSLIGQAFWLYASVGILLWCIFFRDILLSGGDVVPGDRGDPRLIIAMLEHWFRTLRGLELWRSPNFFFPVAGVLGYSEAFLFYAILYIPLRIFGLDPFSSYQATLGITLGLAYAGMALLLHRKYHVHPLPGAAAAGFFAFPWLHFTGDSHTQMYAIALVPYIVWAAMNVGEQWEQSGTLPMRPALTAVALFALLATTSFYCAWFFSLFLAIVGVTALVIALRRKGGSGTAHALQAAFSGNWTRVSILMLCSLVLIAPFLAIYLPVLPDHPLADWEFVRRSLPSPITEGLRGPLLLAFLWGLLVCSKSLWGAKEHEGEVFPLDRRIGMIALVPGIATLVMWVLMYQIAGHTLWYLIFQLFPGGYAIRAVDRANAVLLVPMAILSAVGLTALLKLRVMVPNERKILFLAVLGLSAWQVGDQYEANHMQFSKSKELRFLASVPQPPSSCRAFAYVWDSPVKQQLYEYQTDAILIAQKFNLPTVNGYSGRAPSGWNLMSADQGDIYADQVRRWAAQEKITSGLCTYLVAEGTWGWLDLRSRAQ